MTTQEEKDKQIEKKLNKGVIIKRKPEKLDIEIRFKELADDEHTDTRFQMGCFVVILIIVGLRLALVSIVFSAILLTLAAAIGLVHTRSLFLISVDMASEKISWGHNLTPGKKSVFISEVEKLQSYGFVETIHNTQNNSVHKEVMFDLNLLMKNGEKKRLVQMLYASKIKEIAGPISEFIARDLETVETAELRNYDPDQR